MPEYWQPTYQPNPEYMSFGDVMGLWTGGMGAAQASSPTGSGDMAMLLQQLLAQGGGGYGGGGGGGTGGGSLTGGEALTP
jgi:hypothetical protein